MLQPKRIMVCPYCRYMQFVGVNRCKRCRAELTIEEKVAASQLGVVEKEMNRV